MWKAVLAGTTALAIAGSTVVYAQQQRGNRQDGPRRGPSIEDMRAFADARLAGLRAGLALSAEQQQHWPAFEGAARTMQQLRIDRVNTMRQARQDGGMRGGAERRALDPAERMRQQAARMTDTGAALRKLADAMAPLYQSLDDAQKRRFAVLSRMGGPRGGQPGRFQRGGDDGPPAWHRGQRRTDATPEGTESGAPTATPLSFSRKGASDTGFRGKAPVEDGAIFFRGKAPGFQSKAGADTL